MRSPGSNKTFIKNSSNPPVLDPPLIHMMPFHLQIHWLFPRPGKNHTFILNTIHLLYVTLTPLAYLFRTKTHWNERKPWNNGSVLFKWLYVLLYLDYKCKTLSFEGQDGNGLQLEKIGPTFSSFHFCVPSRDWTREQSFLCFVISARRCQTF